MSTGIGSRSASELKMSPFLIMNMDTNRNTKYYINKSLGKMQGRLRRASSLFYKIPLPLDKGKGDTGGWGYI